MQGQRRLIATLSVVVVAVLALMGYLIWTGYQEALHRTETEAKNYAAPRRMSLRSHVMCRLPRSTKRR